MLYRALDLSRYIVNKCIAEDNEISNLQLQKILFYIQRHFLQELDRAAFADEIEAWMFGPVVPNVYYYFCAFGATPIFIDEDPYNIEDNDKECIDDLIVSKRILDPWDLVNETHKPGGAWDRVYANGQGNRHPIPVDLIREFG